VEELLGALGASVDRAAVLKALSEGEEIYVLLEEGGTQAAGPRAGEPIVPYSYHGT
jgi:hypothetical protein